MSISQTSLTKANEKISETSLLSHLNVTFNMVLSSSISIKEAESPLLLIILRKKVSSLV